MGSRIKSTKRGFRKEPRRKHRRGEFPSEGMEGDKGGASSRFAKNRRKAEEGEEYKIVTSGEIFAQFTCHVIFENAAAGD